MLPTSVLVQWRERRKFFDMYCSNTRLTMESGLLHWENIFNHNSYITLVYFNNILFRSMAQWLLVLSNVRKPKYAGKNFETVKLSSYQVRCLTPCPPLSQKHLHTHPLISLFPSCRIPKIFFKKNSKCFLSPCYSLFVGRLCDWSV